MVRLIASPARLRGPRTTRQPRAAAGVNRESGSSVPLRRRQDLGEGDTVTAIADAAKAVLDAYYAGTARPAFVTIAVPRIDGEATPTSDRLETEIRAAAKDHSRKPDVRFLRVELRSVAATGLSFIVAGMGG